MSLRIKLVLVGVLLFLALGTTALAAGTTFQAFQRLQQQNTLVKTGDVRSIRPWMTIPYIARVCHVPERYLYRWLNIPYTPSMHHATLQALSIRYKRPVDEFVREVQTAVRTYRKQHPDSTNQPVPGLPTRGINPTHTVQKKAILVSGRNTA